MENRKMGLSNTQQAILMFLAFFLPPFAAWLGAGAPTDHAGIALLFSAIVGGTGGGIIAWIKEILGGKPPIDSPA
jgi:uncharacterized membrane protein YqaE (UPF0057 family)